MHPVKVILILFGTFVIGGFIVVSIINLAMDGDLIAFIILYFGGWALVPFVVNKIGPVVENVYLFFYRIIYNHLRSK